jgi:hypothetical protein
MAASIVSRAASQTMDKKFAPNWHCIMGGSLGFEVTLLLLLLLLRYRTAFLSMQMNYFSTGQTSHLHQVVCEKHSLLYMYYGGNVAILLFKY